MQTQGLTFEQQKELLLLQLQHDWLKHEVQIKKQVEIERIRQETETERARLEFEVSRLYRSKSDEQYGDGKGKQDPRHPFDLNNLRLLPQFHDSDPG